MYVLYYILENTHTIVMYFIIILWHAFIINNNNNIPPKILFQYFFIIIIYIYLFVVVVYYAATIFQLSLLSGCCLVLCYVVFVYLNICMINYINYFVFFVPLHCIWRQQCTYAKHSFLSMCTTMMMYVRK